MKLDDLIKEKESEHNAISKSLSFSSSLMLKSFTLFVALVSVIPLMNNTSEYFLFFKKNINYSYLLIFYFITLIGLFIFIICIFIIHYISLKKKCRNLKNSINILKSLK